MNGEQHQKVTASHLQRDAYLYVRQSTLRQVLENTESTERQYALRQRAVGLGWPVERVIVIDSDQGQSGASDVDREGFQKLVTEVSLGRVGIVLGLEVSRLARNNADWHRLLEICALTNTLILDADGLYDPAHFNDRLLLGMKGTLSEAELHVLNGRLQGGIKNKAQRGELKMPLPTGLVYDELNRVVLDPDRQVQQSFITFFDTFERTGTAIATVKYFRREGWLFPRRIRRGANKGTLVWVTLDHSRALKTLHNPRYAGAFFRGRTRTRKSPQGNVRTGWLPQEEWEVLLPDSHPGYITWEQYQRHQQRLLENAQTQGNDRRKSPPGEGPALLQGIAICGVCGERMTQRYRSSPAGLKPIYRCQKEGPHGRLICQSIRGHHIDKAIGQLLCDLVTPVALEAAIEIQHQLQGRLDEADQLRKQQVVRARYEADVAQQRFMQVDPNNRLVADTLESDWNEKLRAVNRAQEEYEQRRQADQAQLDEEQRQQILSLASDFPRLWHDERTPRRERKRLVRLMIEDVTLSKGEQLKVEVCLRGGATRTLTLPAPSPAWNSWQTDPTIVAEIDRLLNDHTTREVAHQLNERGLHSGKGGQFTHVTIGNISKSYGLKSRYQRLREAGMLTADEIAEELGICTNTVQAWRRRGLLKTHAYGRRQHVYEPPGENKPVKWQECKRSDPRRSCEVPSDDMKGV